MSTSSMHSEISAISTLRFFFVSFQIVCSIILYLFHCPALPLTMQFFKHFDNFFLFSFLLRSRMTFAQAIQTVARLSWRPDQESALILVPTYSGASLFSLLTRPMILFLSLSVLTLFRFYFFTRICVRQLQYSKH